jgi:hypothetical protein
MHIYLTAVVLALIGSSTVHINTQTVQNSKEIKLSIELCNKTMILYRVFKPAHHYKSVVTTSASHYVTFQCITNRTVCFHRNGLPHQR